MIWGFSPPEFHYIHQNFFKCSHNHIKSYNKIFHLFYSLFYSQIEYSAWHVEMVFRMNEQMNIEMNK